MTALLRQRGPLRTTLGQSGGPRKCWVNCVNSRLRRPSVGKPHQRIDTSANGSEPRRWYHELPDPASPCRFLLYCDTNSLQSASECAFGLLFPANLRP
ncbi:MAG: hypothetical protein JWR49_3841 [Tardiphaga sp.]|jgi:hypothetical protein|nr:hypothetical protein [Tardiphaga sp.]